MGRTWLVCRTRARQPRLLDADTEENLHRLFSESRWTDFAPVVLPTEERVAAMLAGTSHAPDEVVGRLRPTAYREYWEFTVEKVAVNAVMAGASPAYLPVILAMAASGVSGRSSSTTSQATVALVNGPIRDEIGMNYGIGAMGPYSHANATIGRAYGLLSQNLQGGSVPHETYMGSQGNFLSYNATFAENEQASPWEPFHVQHGFKPEDSTVSLFLGGWYTVFGGGPARDVGGEVHARVCRRAIRIPARSSRSIRSSRAASSISGSTRSRSSSTGASSTRACRPGNTGTTSGFKRCTGRARSPASNRTRRC